MSFILVVFFGTECEQFPPFLDDDEETKKWMGLPLWIPSKYQRDWEDAWEKAGSPPKLKVHNAPVYHWAIDYVSASDQRWVAFGEFKSLDEAKKAYMSLHENDFVIGYRVMTDWTFSSQFEVDCVAYTDG